jgi:hypothetical protein
MAHWRLIGAWLLTTVVLAVITPPAVAQTGEFERITARVRAGWVNQDNGTTRFDELFVYNATAPTSVSVACRGLGCAFSRTPELRVPDSGILRLSTLRGLRRPFPPGTVLETTLTVPGGQKVVSYRTRRRGDPTLTRSCSFPGALPSACSAPCPPPAGIDGAYCATAGQDLPRARDAFNWVVAASRDHVKLLQLRLRRVQPGSTVGVFCFGKSCPFGARFYSASGGAMRLEGGLRRRRLRAGTVIEVRTLLGNTVGNVRRLTLRNLASPRYEVLCLYPAELEPRSCPS